MQNLDDQAVTDPQRLAALQAARKRDAFDYVAWVFAPLGALFLIIGIVDGVHTVNFRSGAETADAVVVERIPHQDDKGSTTYSVTVEYAVDGHSYRYNSGDSSNPAPQLGKHLKVFYRPGNPGDARFGGLAGWTGSLIMAPLGLIFFGIGLGLGIWGRRTRRRRERAARVGRPLTCVVESVVANTTYSGNGDSSTDWVLTARYDDPPNSTVLRFKRNYSKKPRTAASDSATVTVFVDPDDPSNYLVAAD